MFAKDDVGNSQRVRQRSLNYIIAGYPSDGVISSAYHKISPNYQYGYLSQCDVFQRPTETRGIKVKEGAIVGDDVWILSFS